jgi:hypothetical protein
MFLSRASGLWRRAVLWQDTNVPKVHAASIFTLKTEVSRSSGTPTPHHNTTRCDNPEDLDFNLQDRESFKSLITILPQILSQRVLYTRTTSD